jgi:nicotinic acid mononucleotide adenylyltransferase
MGHCLEHHALIGEDDMPEPPSNEAVLSARFASERRRYERAARLLDSPMLVGRLAAEIEHMDSAAPPRAVILSGARRARQAMRAGVFSGSFNPLTLAHSALADAARAQAGIDCVVWLVAARTIGKERMERASLPDRLAQLVAFARAERGNAIALTNRGLYVDEARALGPLLAPGAALVMLVGFDKIVQILDPGYYADRDAALRELFARTSVLVAPRSGAGRAELDRLLRRPENRPFAVSVSYLEMPPMHAGDSSTQARACTYDEQWDSLHALVPPEGEALAHETGAYAAKGTDTAARYALRERWIRALGALDLPARRTLPGLATLLRLTAAPDARGAALREWLAHYERQGQIPPLPLVQ